MMFVLMSALRRTFKRLVDLVVCRVRPAWTPRGNRFFGRLKVNRGLVGLALVVRLPVGAHDCAKGRRASASQVTQGLCSKARRAAHRTRDASTSALATFRGEPLVCESSTSANS